MHLVAPWGSLGSFGFIEFFRARPGGRRPHAGSLGSFEGALGVVGFIRALPGVVVFIRVRWVHSGAPL